MALVRDPFFWQRFSQAVHLDEEIRSTTEEKEQSDNWLASQRRKRRKSALWGCIICLAVALLKRELETQLLYSNRLSGSYPFREDLPDWDLTVSFGVRASHDLDSA
ncbi:predicted protein [Aspergillus nidulans FGSC A4]|uniref:Uncharacterized protein n=1 Tax=Emericella nidulans (strain FGSC A4 / ATCC 38163 / CBS 112.46 / NRRL 194 / M139) TaxID=227321 RepID=Q5ARE3_EMENI|nr:hypothetical protein [Aspergillus nidulans FGSC A4]EAA61970.1 predicted protein [Aspergillus nidulans FGSC A4]CBF82473.1 TPA: conserved hypothetical protein [Aspergillus nidulans FGSC A4]|eukprot:XP_682406.1 predicted protein [Aspergillus nidulans FGSC A4]